MRLTLLLLLLAFAIPAYATGFLKEIDDVPIPEGFTVSDEEPLVYDTPSGRIVETTIEGKGEEESIAKFYLDALPELGWKQNDRGKATDELESLTFSFEKEDEKVDMTIKEDAARVQVKFSLYPAD